MKHKRLWLAAGLASAGLGLSGFAAADSIAPPAAMNGAPVTPPTGVPPGGLPAGAYPIDGTGMYPDGMGGSGGPGGASVRSHACDRCPNIPPGVQPAPPGTYVNKFIKIQAGKAETDDFVIYKHMWYRGGTQLGPLGRYQLDLITRRLSTVPFPVIIETNKDDTLDGARRDVIVALLQARGFTDPDRVIVAYPIAEGLHGDEGFRIYNGMINIGGPGGGLGGVGTPGTFGFGGFPGAGFGGFSGVGIGNPFGGGVGIPSTGGFAPPPGSLGATVVP
jgi:hypothetical protein